LNSKTGEFVAIKKLIIDDDQEISALAV